MFSTQAASYEKIYCTILACQMRVQNESTLEGCLNVK